MRWVVFAVLILWPATAIGQSRSVLPQDLELEVKIEATEYVPYVREMVLLTIRGVYRRHITREALVQPDFDGFSWTQLGPDLWKEERIEGERVKTMTRRMAIYPDRAGTLEIGAFTHRLTLTDELDEWFEHEIRSAPLSLTVAPAPPHGGWWFPVRSLRISDQWSNAPDQLARGEGVLRVIRLEAVGVTPEMIPPMPELRSPSGMIFPHPDKRLVELSPDGPITYAFWRWTIRPGNDTSAVVEPLSFSYFDTALRQPQTVSISAQRIAYGDAVPVTPAGARVSAETARLPGWPMLLLGAAVCVAGTVRLGAGRRLAGLSALRRYSLLDPLAWRLRRAAHAGDRAATRRYAAQIMTRDASTAERARLLSGLDDALFRRDARVPDLRGFARAFLRPVRR